MFSFRTLLFAALVAQQASALTARDVLFLRQDDPDAEIPAECETPCTGPVNAIETCDTVDCVCNAQIVQQLTTCFSCVVSVDGPPSPDDLAQAQASLDAYEDQCAAAGSPVSSLTVTSTSLSVTGTGTVIFSLASPTRSDSEPSIFFSSDGSPASVAGSSTPAVTSPSATSAPGGSTSPSVGFSSPGAANTASGSSTAATSSGSLNPTAASGAQTSFGGLYKLSAVAASVLGGAFVLFNL